MLSTSLLLVCVVASDPARLGGAVDSGALASLPTYGHNDLLALSYL